MIHLCNALAEMLCDVGTERLKTKILFYLTNQVSIFGKEFIRKIIRIREGALKKIHQPCQRPKKLKEYRF